MGACFDAETAHVSIDESLRCDLAAAWLRQRARAREEGRSQWLALRLRVAHVDPLSLFLDAPEDVRFFWAQPQAGVQRAGVGIAWAFDGETMGETDRFAAAGHAVADVLERIEVVGDPGPVESGPVIQAGFSFAGPDEPRGVADDDVWAAFADADLVLAAHQRVRLGQTCFESSVIEVSASAEDHGWHALLTPFEASEAIARGAHAQPRLEIDVTPEYAVRADRSHASYEAMVRDALREIEGGRFDKVVVARALDVHHPGRFDVGGFLERLMETYPQCTTFAVARDRDVFVSASPERLVQLRGDVARTAALAGSAVRGRTPESDERLGAELVACPKNRAEHRAVVEAIVDVLGRHAAEVSADAEPRLMKLEGIQHLETPIEAKLGDARSLGRPGEALVSLVGELHPTPAVGGRPAAPAVDWIAHHESLDRGWYAAPVGFVDLAGDGEFRVALRSALLRDPADVHPPCAHARLFAGAGIVAGSDPHAELVETRVKLRALLAPLTEI